MNTDLAKRIESLLVLQHVMSLATLGPDGPHAVNLFFAYDGLKLIWVSDPDSLHSRQIEADRRVAATVAPDCSDFSAIRGVQINGTAERITAADERARCLERLETRYPFLRQLADAPSKLREAHARAAVYMLRPVTIILIDNSDGFGHKESLKIDA